MQEDFLKRHRQMKYFHSEHWYNGELLQREKIYFMNLLDLKRVKRSLYPSRFLITDIGPEKYELSILTNSHCESVELGTIEVALIKNGAFFMGDNDTNDSIIHYMEFDDFKHMVDKIENDVEKIEDIFSEYKRKNDNN